MGSETSMQMIEHPLPRDYKCSPQNPKVYVSLINQTKLQKHIISITNKQDLEYEQQMFIFRKCHSDHIIPARYFENLSYVQYCAKSYQVCYYTDYPQYLFSEIQHITFQELLVNLIDALKGFSILSQKVGWFRVNHRMITFDHDHKVKVWLSDNFSETRVRKQRILKTEHQFLNKIISIFDSKLESNQQCFHGIITKNAKDMNIDKLTLNIVLNILIKIIEYSIQEKRIRNKITQQKRFSHEAVMREKYKQNHKKVSSKNGKQRSLKRARKASQQSAVEQKKMEVSNTQNTTNFMSHNISQNQSIAKCNYAASQLFRMNRNTYYDMVDAKRLEQRFSVFDGQPNRQDKNHISHEKQIIIQRKKVRKSMDQYQLNKQNINQSMNNQQTFPQKKNPTSYLPIFSNFLPFNSNYVPPLNLGSGKISKRELYEGYLIKTVTNNKRANNQNVQKQKITQQQTQKMIGVETKDRTSLAINLNRAQQKKSIKQEQKAIIQVENILKSNLMSSNGAILGDVNTIKSIVYSENGNQEKPQSVIIHSINSTIGNKTFANAFQRTPSFNKYIKQ